MNSGIEEAHPGTRQKERVVPSGQLENYREKSFFNDWFNVLKVDGYASLEYLLALLLAVVWSELTCLQYYTILYIIYYAIYYTDATAV